MHNMDHVSRTGKGKGLRQASLMSGDPKRGLCLACWEGGSVATISTKECSGEVTIFMRFSSKEAHSGLSAMSDPWGESSRPEFLKGWPMDCLHLNHLGL